MHGPRVTRGRRQVAVALASALLGAVTAVGPTASASGSGNADKVDGFDAVRCSTPVASRGRVLVATCSNGRLPNNIIVRAPNSAKLSGRTLAQVIARAQDRDVVQARVKGTCAAGSAIRRVARNGSVACETMPLAWLLGGNAGTDPAVDFLGTTDNQPLVVVVNGQRVMRYEPTPGTPNVVGGSSGNSVDPGSEAVTIAGGGAVAPFFVEPNSAGGFASTVSGGAGNTTSGNESTVGGGFENTASAGQSTVGGGQSNHATGGLSTVGGGFNNTASGTHATVGGGSTNTASATDSTVAGGVANFATGTNSGVTGGSQNGATALDAAVTGGFQNLASGDNATVGGGVQNLASGPQSFVAGGFNNFAQGTQSFAAGTTAVASDNGSFVWADGIVAGFNSNTFPCTGQANCTPTSGVNTFNVRATGGIRFVTALNGSGAPLNGCYLAAGGGTWNCLSDRHAKRGFRPVDDGMLLRALDRMPVKTWSYRSEPGSVRHMGPTAQAFSRAFHLGSDPAAIDSIDEAGVALAAIKGLYGTMVAQRHTIAAQHSRIRSLAKRVASLERTVRRLVATSSR